jgi:hypothetical protein
VTAAALFAALGPTQFLGAFATYDAMALFVMAAAAWCVVAAHDREDSSWLLIAGAVLLTLANATKYASMLFDPAIVALSGLTAVMNQATASTVGRGRLKIAVGRAGLVGGVTLALVAGLLALGGSWYLAGLMSTTLSRSVSNTPPSQVIVDAAKWIGLVCIPAALATGLALARRRRHQVESIVVAVLALSAVLAPLNQARIHTGTSLSKHVDFGIWFGAAAAGYLIAQLSRVGRRRWVPAGAALTALTAALIPATLVGTAQSAAFYQAWPNSTVVTDQLAALTQEYPGRYLVEDDPVPDYYLEKQVRWDRWQDTWYFAWPPPGSKRTLINRPAWKAAILRHHFKLIVLDFGDTAQTDYSLVTDLREAGDYHLIAELPYWDQFGTGQFTVWLYRPPTVSTTSVHRIELRPETP